MLDISSSEHDGRETARKLDLSTLNTKARRNLKAEDLQKLYTEEELDQILDYKPDRSDSWYGQLQLLKQHASKAKPRQRRRWSHIEDKFLYDTYRYLPDSSIALALNIPKREVSRHRIALKLAKTAKADAGDFVVWHYRDDFETDIEKYQLTKARGGGIHPLLENVNVEES